MDLCEGYAGYFVLVAAAVAFAIESCEHPVVFLHGWPKVILRAKHDAMRCLPAIWRKRQQIQKARIISIGEIWRLLDKRMIPVRRES